MAHLCLAAGWTRKSLDQQVQEALILLGLIDPVRWAGGYAYAGHLWTVRELADLLLDGGAAEAEGRASTILRPEVVKAGRVEAVLGGEVPMSTTSALVVPAQTRPTHDCTHQPKCPVPEANDREAARAVAHDYVTGWSLLCNGVVVFDDTGDLLPDRTTIPPHRGPAPHALVRETR